MDFFKNLLDYIKTRNNIPLVFKLFYCLFFLTIIYFNIIYYGISNLLWFSHFALILLLIGILTENNLIISMMGLTSLLFYLGWSLMFIFRLLFGFNFQSLDYMFLSNIPIYVRSLSLFHIIIPFFVIYLINSLGYNKNALKYQSFLGVLLLIVTYILSPEKNINWIYGIVEPQSMFHPLFYLLLLCFGLLVLIYPPTHFILSYFFEDSS